MKPTLGSLFAGIGGIDLGFERAGFETIWQVEQNEYCRKVLAKNHPKADRRVTDVRNGNSSTLSRVDVIAGGFPCQDISVAGRGDGITGERSGLWKEYHRIIGELRPRYVLVENVAALLGRGMDVVLGDLSEIGYDAEWEIISAANVGAPHLRKRVWIVAYPRGIGWNDGENSREGRHLLRDFYGNAAQNQSQRQRRVSRVSAFGENVADPQRFGPQEQRELIKPVCPAQNTNRETGRTINVCLGEQWRTEPNVGRVAHGVPFAMDRLRGLGNAVVPQIPERIAQLILKDMNSPENGQGEE